MGKSFYAAEYSRRHAICEKCMVRTRKNARCESNGVAWVYDSGGYETSFCAKHLSMLESGQDVQIAVAENGEPDWLMLGKGYYQEGD